jgi:hypothetical protein
MITIQGNIKQAQNKDKNTRKSTKFLGFIVYLTSLFVSLAVGFGMIGRTLTIPFLSDIWNGLIVVIAGWIVVILTVAGVFLKIADKIASS